MELWKRNRSSKKNYRLKKNDNNEVLAKLQTTKQNINNMEKHNKDLEKIKVNKDSLKATMM